MPPIIYLPKTVSQSMRLIRDLVHRLITQGATNKFDEQRRLIRPFDASTGDYTGPGWSYLQWVYANTFQHRRWREMYRHGGEVGDCTCCVLIN